MEWDRQQWDAAIDDYIAAVTEVTLWQDGKVVATQGDPEAPVNRGLNCIKGYFLSKIMYGKDRLTQPMLRMKDGKFDKNGEFIDVLAKFGFGFIEVGTVTPLALMIPMPCASASPAATTATSPTACS